MFYHTLKQFSIDRAADRTIVFSLATIVFVGVVSATPLSAQNQDSIQLVQGQSPRNVAGSIVSINPLQVTINARNTTQEYPAHLIQKLVFRNQPPEIERARGFIENGRFDDAFEMLQGISDPVDRAELRSEIEFLKALSAAEIAFRGGNKSAQDAGRAVMEFTRNHPQSIHFYAATELLGRLLFAVGKFDLASAEFAKLPDSRQPELTMRGLFWQSEALMELDRPDEASDKLQQILNRTENDDLTQQYQLLARVRLAKAQAMQGQPAPAIAAIEKIIQTESADNGQLFAYAYNSLGSIHLSQNQLKEAMMAFLHTELLFPDQADPHSEALYQLALIWPQLNHNERANRARSIVKSRYRNTVWATRL